MSSHDALMVASGITTVLDAVAIGDARRRRSPWRTGE